MAATHHSAESSVGNYTKEAFVAGERNLLEICAVAVRTAQVCAGNEQSCAGCPSHALVWGCYPFLPLLRRKTKSVGVCPSSICQTRRDALPRGGFAMTYRRLVPVCMSFLLLTFLIAPLVAGTPSESAFKKLQSLAGKWEGKDGLGRAAKTTFEVLASGTAVMEKLEASGMEEMVTLYSVDRDGIALVHYCPTNNQPRMLVVPSSGDVKELSFDYQGAGNLASPSTGHQHHLVLRFEDDNHITETWTWREGDKDTPMVFHFSRKKN